MPQQAKADKVYETLRREHEKLDAKVQALEGKRWVSAAEEAEIRRLKRLKLQKKDQMRELQPEV